MKMGTWFIALVAAVSACSVANATPVFGPEIEAASSMGAISVLLGALAVVAERRRKR